jgi:5-methylthioadenosine/S-adenosylhomocysteine deaminase
MRQVILGQNLALHRERAAGQPSPEPRFWATAETVLEMATRGGAHTLFMDEVSGALEVGKAADCVIVNLDCAAMRPNFDDRRTLGILVWGGDTQIVDTVFVAGRKLLAGGRSCVWEEGEVIVAAEKVLREIVAETGLDSLLAPRKPGHSYRGWRYI